MKLTKEQKSRKKRKQATRLLTTAPVHLILKEYLQMEEWLSHHQDGHEPYQALQGLRRVYAQTDIVFIKSAFSQWVNHYLIVEHRKVRRIAKTVVKREEQHTVHSIQYHVSNGKIEGINNKIKIMK